VKDASMKTAIAKVRWYNMKRTSGMCIASSPGHSQILSRSYGEKSGEGLGSKLCHGLEMVDSVSM